MTKLKADNIDVDSIQTQLTKAIANAFKKGTDDAFSGKSFLKDLNAEMEEFTKKQKAQRLNDIVAQTAINKKISTREAELAILARVAKMQNNANIADAMLDKKQQERALKKAQNANDTLMIQQYQNELKEIDAQIESLTKENALITEKTAGLQKQLKIQREKDALEAKAQAVADKTKEVKNALLGQFGITEKIIDQLKTPELAKAIFAQQMIEKLGKATDTFIEFKRQGLSAGQAVQASFKMMSFKNLIGLADNKGVMNGIIEQYGNVNALSSQLVDDLGVMAKQLGISGEEALGLNASLSQMPGETSQSAANSMKQVGAMAKIQGIAPGKIMKDMAKNTEAMALFGSRGAVAFGKAVIELHKMGVELSTSVSMAKGLLDFESSINAQMEASVLLGREINLDKAREMALNHDIEGATREVLRNVGGQAQFGRMNMVQQEALAKAAGMTTEELQKAVDAQMESSKYSGESAGFWNETLGTTIAWGSALVKSAASWGPILLSGFQMLTQLRLIKALQGDQGGLFSGLFSGFKKGASDTKDLAKQVAAMKALNPALTSKDALAQLRAAQVPGKEGMLDKLQKIDAKAMLSTAKAIAAVGIALIGVGLGIKFASEGLAGLVESFKGLTSEQMNSALLAIGLVMVGFTVIVALLAKVSTIAVIPLLALAAAFLGIGYGIKLATDGIGNMVKQFGEIPYSNLMALPATMMGIAAGLASMASMGFIATPVIQTLTALGKAGPALSNVKLGAGQEGGELKNSSESSAVVESLGQVVKAIGTLSDAIATRKGDVIIDGTKVGKVLLPIIENRINFGMR